MSAGWVAPTVRARAMARRRVGAQLVRRVAGTGSLPAGLAALAGTAFEPVAAETTLAGAEHRVRAERLWELRVLAGWLPGSGIPLARALAARYEMANIELHHARLTGRAESATFELGALATSWPRLAGTSSTAELRRELAASRWGDPGGDTPEQLHEALSIAWLRMVAVVAHGVPMVRRWLAAAAALLVARSVAGLVPPPSPLAVKEAAALVGRGWVGAASLGGLRSALPSDARWVLVDVDEAALLWRAEARLRAQVEADGFRMLHAARPGPEPVVGALAVLAVDGWRVRAALGYAAGTGSSEVLDVLA